MNPVPGTDLELDWPTIASRFHILSANDVLAMHDMERHQSVGRKWLARDAPPLALLFVSHRWQTLEHPDPRGHQLAALQEFLRLVCRCLEAMFLTRDERIQLVPTLKREGVLQAGEIARRLLGFGPFSADLSRFVPDARSVIGDAFNNSGHDRTAFRARIADKLGVWLDYSCMPQKPLSSAEAHDFQQAMLSLGALVKQSTVVALRYEGDEYAARGWCAGEYYLGSMRSFARGLFIDIDRMLHEQEVSQPRPPVANAAIGEAAKIMGEAYVHDLAAFREACDHWLSVEPAFSDVGPPDAWARFRDLQGSGYFNVPNDPNPFRRALQLVMQLEETLVERWLLSDEGCTLDIGAELEQLLELNGLRCSDPADRKYVALLLASNGWIAGFRSMLDDCLRWTVANYDRGGGANRRGPVVRLQPLSAEDRAVFDGANPRSAAAWRSRLGESGVGRSPSDIGSRAAAMLAERPPRYVLVDQ